MVAVDCLRTFEALVLLGGSSGSFPKIPPYTVPFCVNFFRALPSMGRPVVKVHPGIEVPFLSKTTLLSEIQ
jgi:hypothetical protein